MLRFVVRRLLLLVPILLGLSILVFLWIRALPGGPAQALLGERATAESIAEIEEIYGLDRPLHEQYLAYLETVVKFDMGTSITSRRPVVTRSRSGSRRRSSSRSPRWCSRSLWGSRSDSSPRNATAASSTT